MNIKQALEALGSYTQQIRETLQQQGIKGKRGSCKDCPVAVYLNKVVDNTHPICVGTLCCWTVVNNTTSFEDFEDEVQQFIAQFDAKWYPELDADEGAESHAL